MDEMKTTTAEPVAGIGSDKSPAPTTPNIGLQAYISHKRVMAAKIISVSGNRLTFENGATEAFDVKLFHRYTPVAGDYLIIYPDSDGYQSISPRQAFEDGYHPDEPPPTNDQALLTHHPDEDLSETHVEDL